MIDATPSLEGAARLSASAVASYLKSTGWAVQPSLVGGVAIFSKSLPGADEQIHIVLPELSGIEDERRRVADALRTIEATEERPLLTIIEEIYQASGKSNPSRNTGSPNGRYLVTSIDNVEPAEAMALERVGIRTIVGLLEAAKSPGGRKELARKTGIEAKRLLNLANAADQMRIKSMGAEYVELLRAVGVMTIRELRFRNPARLAKAMLDANKKQRLVRVVPSEDEVASWIKDAKQLPLKISH